MAPILPTLTSVGWLKNPKDIMGTLFANALVSDYSQSNIYQGTITSISYIVFTHQNNIDALTTALRDQLEKYYSRYFDNTLTVETASSINSNGKYTISCNISAIANGELLALATIGTLDDGVLKDVIYEINK